MHINCNLQIMEIHTGPVILSDYVFQNLLEIIDLQL